jgi:hypothetical protein
MCCEVYNDWISEWCRRDVPGWIPPARVLSAELARRTPKRGDAVTKFEAELRNVSDDPVPSPRVGQ